MIYASALTLRIPTGSSSWLRMRVSSEPPLRADLVAAHLPPEWLEAGPHDLDVEIHAIEHPDPSAATGFAEAANERIEHFKGAWITRHVSPSGTRLFDADGHYAIWAEGSPVQTVRLWRRPPAPSVASLVLRIVRDLLHQHLVANGYVLLHAALVSREGLGVAFVGDKGAGKSAWMLRSLSRGWDLLANDRVFVHPNTRDSIALPIAAMLDRRSLQHLPTGLRDDIAYDRILRRDHHLPGYAKVGLTPLELTHAFGVTLSSRCELRHVVLLGEPQPSPDAVLARNIYTPRDPTYAFALLDPSGPAATAPEQLQPVMFQRLVVLSFDWSRFDTSVNRTPAPDLHTLLEPWHPRQPLEGLS